MAREFHPLMMKDLEIVVSGSKIHRLALNRHMPRVEKVETHEHPHEQMLLYLRGSGIQVVEEGPGIPVRRGVLIFLRKHQRHGFRKERNVSPVCLAIDLETDNLGEWPPEALVSGEGLLAIEQNLHHLGGLRNPTNLEVASGVLEVVRILEGELRGVAKATARKYSRMVNQWMAHSDPWNWRPAEAARGLDRSIDYLNRQLNRELNTSLGRLLNAAKFEKAGRLLKETSRPIGEVAEQVGFLDQNYFARWFRKQSGLTPSQWRKSWSRRE